MKKFDHYLLTRYPILWQSRIHWVFLFWLIYATLCAFGGIGSTVIEDGNHYYHPDDEGDVYTLFSLISIVGCIGYFFFLTKYNHFKWFGKSNFLFPAYNFILIFSCFLMINSGYFVFHYFKSMANPDAVRYADRNMSFIYYMTLHLAVYTFIFRHIKSRQFILGGVFAGIVCIFLVFFCAVSHTTEVMAVYTAFSFIALLITIATAKLSTGNLFPTCLIMYHSFLPYFLNIINKKNHYYAGISYRTYPNEYNWMIDETITISFVITLLLVVLVTGPVARLQWGKED